MKKIFLFFLGNCLISISLFFAFLYFNLFTFGYTFSEYVYFISRRFECILFVPGLLCLFFAFKRGDKKHALLL